jgi:hypothetical protein
MRTCPFVFLSTPPRYGIGIDHIFRDWLAVPSRSRQTLKRSFNAQSGRGRHEHRLVGRIARDRHTEIFALRSAPPDSLRLLFNAIVQAHNDSAYTAAFHAVDMIRGLSSMTTNMKRRSVQQSHIWRMKRPCVIGIGGFRAFFPRPRLHRISCCFISPAKVSVSSCSPKVDNSTSNER